MQVFNLRLDALVTAVFMALVALIVVEAARACRRALGESRPPNPVSTPVPQSFS